MSVRVIGKVWDDSEARGNDLLVLLALADNADEDRALAWPSVETIARKARVDKRTAQRCLRRLEDAGEVDVVRAGGRTSEGYRSTVYRVTPGQGRQTATHDGGATETATTGDRNGHSGVTPAPPQPSVEPSTTVKPATARASAKAPPDFPDGFPSEWRPVAQRVAEVLGEIAAARAGMRPVQLAAVARAMHRFPDRDHLAVAQDSEHYLVWGDGAHRSYSDVVRFYANALDRAPRVARPAHLGDAPRPAGVTPIRGRRPRSQDWRAGSEAIMDVARRPRVAAELAGTVLRSEGHSAAADLVESVGLHEALALARAEAEPPAGWAQAGVS